MTARLLSDAEVAARSDVGLRKAIAFWRVPITCTDPRVGPLYTDAAIEPAGDRWRINPQWKPRQLTAEQLDYIDADEEFKRAQDGLEDAA